MTNRVLKHLLILTPGFPENEADTTCLPYLQQFILSYQQQYPQLKITILSLHYPFNQPHYFWNGIEVYCVQGKNKTGIRRALTIYRAYKQGLKINKRDSIDAILSIWVTDAALAGKHIAAKIKLPHFSWAWGQEVKPGNKYIRLINPNPERLAVMSDYQNNILEQSYGIRAKYIIPNGITESAFPELNIGNRSIDLLAVGSLIPLKQYHLFIDIVKWLRENGYPDIKAVLAGDGVLRGELEALRDTYQLQNNLDILGSVLHTKIFDLMNNAKVFVHPSNYEGHSTVMLEALYSGCKVVGFMPVSSNAVSNFKLCDNIDTMKNEIVKNLSENSKIERIKYSTWKENVEKIHTILTSIIN
jgi:glycosyltransferase involved in cell wall biosynthesis